MERKRNVTIFLHSYRYIIIYGFCYAGNTKNLEITNLSAEDLRVDRKPVTKTAYVVVWIESTNCCTTSASSSDGGSYPSWNEKFTVEMTMHANSITLEVQCKTGIGIRSVGTTRIAASDFLGGILPESYLQFLSYRMRENKGRRNGIINFSMRVKPMSYSRSKPAAETAARAENPSGSHIRALQSAKNSNGFVTGVPVLWGYSKFLIMFEKANWTVN